MAWYVGVTVMCLENTTLRQEQKQDRFHSELHNVSWLIGWLVGT